VCNSSKHGTIQESQMPVINKQSTAKIKQNPLFTEIKTLIEESKQKIAVEINSTITMLYWHIGSKIKTNILNNKRAEYGQETIKQLSIALTTQYGKGWSEKQLRHCLRFAEVFTNAKIVSALRRQLSWTQIKAIMYFDDPLQREFYIEMCKIEKWSSRILEERINSMLYERTAISKKPDRTIKHDLKFLKNEQKFSSDLVFRDPYFLDFLGLRDKYSEKDLETAIIVELQNFIIELGNDFSFMDRQKRISVDNEDYYIDLLFFHRRLKSALPLFLNRL